MRSASTGKPNLGMRRRSQNWSHSFTNAVPARIELAPHVSRCTLRAPSYPFVVRKRAVTAQEQAAGYCTEELLHSPCDVGFLAVEDSDASH
mmetsp:Transcript_49231/g.122323  ORF Transcript_49231/g.122323 Transcript_49231/m.122323 type:complete len:91 (+) Transcript_49231:555-827(+)